MIALSLKLLFVLLFLFSFVRPSFAQEYFFQEEFNVDRPGGQLDPEKWIVYPNRDGCSIDTLKEIAGFVLFKQCLGKSQFPYVITKNDPFPNSDFSVSVKFEYLKAAPWGNGIEFVDKAPGNGEGFTQLFGIGFWEDTSSGLNMRFQFKGDVVYKTTINRNPHIFRLDKEGSVYKMFLDDQLLFTSPSTQEKVHAIYLGNPSVQSPPAADWSWFRVDYIRVTQTSPTEIAPEPFLDLPWDYELKGMTFNEAASSVTSYFDHEYPLLGAGLDLKESQEAQGTIVGFKGFPRSNIKPYSKHDGYDYASLAKVNFKDSVKAAAGGKAYFKTYFPGPLSRCGACGEMIVIDHGNGFMTRYLHLDDSSFLLVNKQNPGPVDIAAGQLIGYVGHTGNTDPSDERGAHIHFDVIQDKNNDGDFEDNIPDGITDPFGWQSSEPDPWEKYSFFYTGQQRTGNKSYYLFTKQLDNLNSSLSSNAAVFNLGKTKMEFPQGATNENLNIIAKSEPNFTNNVLSSLGSVISIIAKTQSGNTVNSFLKDFALTIDFSQFDLSRYNLNTLSIYSSQDGNNWNKETTQINLNNKTASSSLNHLTYFALMAERKDTLAPVTTAVLEGGKGLGNNFHSDVKVNLNALDNEGGLGVEFTAYGFEGENWQTYTEPLIFSDEGTYKIHFYSQDKDENIEDIKTVEFSIDKTIPEAKIFADPNDSQIKVTAEPEDSGEVTVQKNQNKATYNITDPAGNNLEIAAEIKENGIPEEMKILSLKYNSDPPVQLPKNSFSTDFISRPSPKSGAELIRVNQFFEMEGQGKYIIFADAKKNMTKIDYYNGRLHTSEEKPGIVLLNLLTNKGKLEYGY